MKQRREIVVGGEQLVNVNVKLDMDTRMEKMQMMEKGFAMFATFDP